MKRKNSGIRWRQDTGFELRCNHCHTYWPLNEDFWNRSALTRCRACWAIYKRARQRAYYRTNPEARAKRKAYQAIYRSEARDAKKLYSHELYWADPERYRSEARARYHAKRDEILVKKRAKYAAEKAA